MELVPRSGLPVWELESVPWRGVSLIRYGHGDYGWRCHLCGKLSAEEPRDVARALAEGHRQAHEAHEGVSRAQLRVVR